MPRSSLIPLEWDSTAVAILSQIAPRDMDDARIWWESIAPHLYQAILDTHLIETGFFPTDEDDLINWLQSYLEQLDADSLPNDTQRGWLAAGLLLVFVGGQYYTISGKRIGWDTVRGALDKGLETGKVNVQELCDQLRSGEITLGDWQQQMTAQIKKSHLAAGLMAAGGTDAGTNDILNIISTQIQEQLEYLQRFADAIANGMPLDGTVCRLMKMYLTSGRGTYHAIEAYLLGQLGYDEYINVLGPTEFHCEGDGGCVGVTAQGWRRVGTLPPIGTRTCLSNCLCSWRYRNSLTGEEIR